MQGQRAFPAELRTSDRGLRIMGPVPSPATNRLNPSVHTMRLVSNSGISCPYVEVYKEDVQVLCARFSSALPTDGSSPIRPHMRSTAYITFLQEYVMVTRVGYLHTQRARAHNEHDAPTSQRRHAARVHWVCITPFPLYKIRIIGRCVAGVVRLFVLVVQRITVCTSP